MKSYNTKPIQSILACLLGLSMLFFTGCKKQETTTNLNETTETPTVVEATVPTYKTQGASFVSTGYKIKSIITPQKVATLDNLTFEVYVDGQGNGQGLLGYKDNVYDVVISNDEVYIQVSSDVVTKLTDISGHMTPIDLKIQDQDNLQGLGFTVVDNKVVSYKANINALFFDNAYQESSSTFDAIPIAQGNSMNIESLVNYILESSASTAPESETETELIPEKESFYLNSKYGVVIDGVTYSIGDYCNPSTYYKGIVPTGFMYSYAYNQDKRVEFQHIKYSDTSGTTEFKCSEGYVQAMTTSSTFSFLSFKKGDSLDSVKAILGIDLKKEEQEVWKPTYPDLEVTKSGSSNENLTITVNDIKVDLIFKNKTLSSISVNAILEFLTGD